MSRRNNYYFQTAYCLEVLASRTNIDKSISLLKFSITQHLEVIWNSSKAPRRHWLTYLKLLSFSMTWQVLLVLVSAIIITKFKHDECHIFYSGLHGKFRYLTDMHVYILTHSYFDYQRSLVQCNEQFVQNNASVINRATSVIIEWFTINFISVLQWGDQERLYFTVICHVCHKYISANQQEHAQ